MSEIDATRLTTREHAVELFGARERHALPQFFLADAEQLDGLYHIIAEVMVEASLDAAQFVLALLGKRHLQVIPNDAMPIFYNAADEQAQHIANDVECAQR